MNKQVFKKLFEDFKKEMTTRQTMPVNRWLIFIWWGFFNQKRACAFMLFNIMGYASHFAWKKAKTDSKHQILLDFENSEYELFEKH